MTTTGNVNITVEDGNSTISAPSQKIQVVIACAAGGPLNQVVATRSPRALKDTFLGGHLPEAAALPTLKGGVVLAMRAEAAVLGTASSVLFSGSGTSDLTLSLDDEVGAWDDYFVQVEILKGGTLGDA